MKIKSLCDIMNDVAKYRRKATTKTARSFRVASPFLRWALSLLLALLALLI